MGIALPQVVTSDRASGAQVIDGSLKFDNDSSQYLSKTFSSAGNRDVWTWSSWVRRSNSTEQCAIFSAYNASNNANYGMIWLNNDGTFKFQNWDGGSNSAETSALLRDTGWYHLVVLHDESASPKAKLYVNGTLQTLASNLSTSQGISGNWEHRIGMEVYNSRKPYDGSMSQCYFIDGQALDASYFGYTDQLTNTWRPKKFSGSFALETASSFTLSDSDFSANNLRSGSNAVTSGVLTDGTLNYDQTFYGNNGANDAYLDIDMTGSSTGELFLVRYWNAAEAGGQTITATCKQVDSGGNDISGTSVSQTWTQGQKWNDGSGYIQQTIQSNTSKIRLIFSGNSNNSFGWGIGEVQIEQLRLNQNSFHLPLDGNSPIGQDQSGRGNNWTPVNFGGSVALDKATGALPILNTDGGGNVARVGVFGSEENLFYTVTTANGSVYQFDITSGDNPALSFIRGATYKFDYSSFTGHPLLFSSTNPDSSTTAYTNGTSTAGNVISFTVPHDAPDTLYYYCQNHPTSMNGAISITTDETKADPYAWKNVLALPLVGSANDVSNSVNSGSTAKTVSVSGDPASNSTQSNFYGASFYFDGSAASDYVSVADNDELDVGSGDFTIECWAYVSGYPNTNPGLLSKRGGNGAAHWQLVLNRNGQIQFGDQATWSNYFGTSSGTTGDQIFKDNWHHIVITRTSGSVQAWYDGRKYGTAINNTTDFSTSANFSVGVGREANYDPFQGYIQDVRVYKGVAKYTSNFIPASTSPDILPDTPSGVSGGSKLAKVTDGAVSFDGTGDYLSLADNADFAFGTGDFTAECFIYPTANASYQAIIDCRDATTQATGWILGVDVNDNIYIYNDGFLLQSGSGITPENRWFHVAYVRNSGVHALYVDGKSVATSSSSYNYTVDSCKIGGQYGGGSEFWDGFISNVRLVKGTALYTTNFTPPTRELTNVTNTKLLCCQSNTSAGSAAVSPNLAAAINDGTVWSDFLSSAAAFNGTHVRVRAFDGNTSTIAGTANNTGYSITGNYNNALEFIPASPIAYSSSIKVRGRNTGQTTMGVKIDTGSGYGSEIALSSDTLQTVVSGSGNLVRMQVVTKTYSGENELGGIAIDDVYLTDPVTVYGNAAATTFNPFNTDINTVRGQETGYCTLNPLDATLTSISDGNLNSGTSGAASWKTANATIAVSSGKWFWEASYNNTIDASNGAYNGVRLTSVAHGTVSGSGIWAVQKEYTYDQSGTGVSLSPAVNPGDIMGFALDLDNSSLKLYVNGVLAKTFSSVTGEMTPYTSSYGSNVNNDLNFGQKPFKYAPPAGFQPLNGANTKPVKVFARPDQYVGVTTYSGNSGDGLSTTQDINVGLNPDLIWIKHRNGTNSNLLTDTVRGLPNTLISNSTAATNTNASRIPALLDNGFRVGDRNEVNDVGGNYVAWCWKAGGNKNTFNVDDVGYASAAAAGLDGGTITPTGSSVGTRQGFSIIQYTGTDASSNTFSHGLSQKPNFAIFKNLSQSGDDWIVYHTSLGATKRVKLNSTAAADSQPSQFNDTEPTSSLFTIGTYDNINKLNNNYISYLWCDIPGLQKFGSYEGNNSTDGPFIELGFRPAIIIFKNIDSSSPNWEIYDFTERDKINPYGKVLSPNTNGEENDVSASYPADALSNGIKIRHNGAAVNAANTYIYAAWAEAPSFNLYGAQSNAR